MQSYIPSVIAVVLCIGPEVVTAIELVVRVTLPLPSSVFLSMKQNTKLFWFWKSNLLQERQSDHKYYRTKWSRAVYYIK